MAAFCEQGSSSCRGRLSGKQNTRIIQASPLRHRLLVCAQSQAEEASFIPDLVGRHLVLVRSAESYNGFDNWQKTQVVAEKDTGQCMDVGEIFPAFPKQVKPSHGLLQVGGQRLTSLVTPNQSERPRGTLAALFRRDEAQCLLAHRLLAKL